MEREAGCLLFHRSKTGVTLTANGEALVPYVRQLVSRQHALDQAMDALSNRVSGRLRVGSFTSFTAIHMPGLIKSFQAEYPDVVIELINGPYRDIEQKILSSQIDCGFLSGVETDGLEFHHLFDDEMFLIVPHGHELAGADHAALRHLEKYDLISQFKGSDHDVHKIFISEGIRPQTRYILDDDISVMGMVSHGMGVALMPEMMLKTADFELSYIRLEPRQFRSIGIASAPMAESTMLVRTFIRFCIDRFHEHMI